MDIYLPVKDSENFLVGSIIEATIAINLSFFGKKCAFLFTKWLFLSKCLCVDLQ